MTRLRFTLLSMLALAVAPLLGAGVVASNPRASSADGFPSDSRAVGGTYFYGQALAAKVVLSQPVDLTQLRFWGSSEAVFSTGLGNVQGFTVMFYNGNASTPALQFSLTRGSSIAEAFMNRSNSDGGKEYQFTSSISGRLAAGTWWMHVGAVLVDGEGDAWMWSSGSNAGIRYAQYGTSWGAWIDSAFSSVAFELSGNPACTSDLDGNASVDMGDIALAMLDFGPCPACPSDLDASGVVDFGDVALLLLDTGPCP